VETGIKETRDWTVPELYVREEDGSTRRLTYNDSLESGLIFSPDGTRAAFSVSNGAGTCRIYTMSLDGGPMTPVTPENEGVCAQAHDWSPDGQWILFGNYYDDPGGELLKIRPDGTGLSQFTCFTTPGTGAWGARWVDGGSRIVVDATLEADGGRYRDGIYSMDSDGNDFRELSSVNVWGDLVISPDGRSLFVATHHWGRKDGEIFEVSLDGGATRRLTDNDLDELDVLLSPDGSKLIYTVGHLWGSDNATARARILDLRSGRSRALRLPETVHLSVSWDTHWQWSPDGTSVAVRTRQQGGAAIVWVSVDGRHSGRLVEERPEMDLFGWLP
jgi:Tol biopolymer transport system component